MSFGTRLKEKRELLGITQPQLAKMLGVSKGAIGNWETDVNSPRATLLYDLFEILHCDANYLFQDETKELYKNKATPEEFENIVKKYRFISEYSPDGVKTVNYILNREYKVAEQIKEISESYEESNIRYVQQYPRLASAGTGQIVFDDMPVDKIGIPDIPEYRKVTYAIGVNGNSMEPLYHDSDILLIEPTCKVDVGEIGIFIIGDESYVKRLGKGKLISLNAEYKDIPLTEYSKCMGRVVDKISNHPDLSFKDMDALREGMISAKPQKKNA